MVVIVTARTSPSVREVVHDVHDCFIDRHNEKTAPSKGQAWRLNKSPCNSANINNRKPSLYAPRYVEAFLPTRKRRPQYEETYFVCRQKRPHYYSSSEVDEARLLGTCRRPCAFDVKNEINKQFLAACKNAPPKPQQRSDRGKSRDGVRQNKTKLVRFFKRRVRGNRPRTTVALNDNKKRRRQTVSNRQAT